MKANKVQPFQRTALAIAIGYALMYSAYHAPSFGRLFGDHHDTE